MSERAVFLDRDGVLNIPLFRDGRSFAPRSLADFVLYPDAAPSVDTFKRAGFAVYVVTNQPDVGAGLLSPSVLDEMHAILLKTVAIDAIATCFDTREQATHRRKPNAGMLYELAYERGVDLARSYMVGDRASDIEAGRRAGCKTVFIDRGYTADARVEGQDFSVYSLAEATAWILRHANAQTNEPA